MSLRRSRIKPAINLAASRRSTAAKSKPGATSSNSSSGGTNSNQKAKPPSKKAQEEKPTKKEPTKKQQPKEAKRPDLDTKDDKEKTKAAELNSSKEGQSRAVDGALKEVITDLAKDGVPEERDTVQSTSVGQKIDDDILVNAEQESLPTEIFDTSTTDEGSNKSSNPVRRKRITAVPNFSQRRAPVTSSKSSLVAKSRPATTRKESEVSPGSFTVTDQKEKKKENNIAAADVIIDGPSDTKENKKTVEPPVVQRKILGKALSTAQKHGNPENKDQSTQRVIERDKLQSASARKDAPILDPITDKAVNGLLSATTEGPQEGMRHGNIYKKRLEEMNALKKEEAPFNRRKRFIQHPKDGIDTSKMKMKDLIYFNPKENKMGSQGANDMEKGSATAKQVNGLSTPRRDEGEGNMESSEETTVAAAPQVKIGPDGNVILDVQSLVKMVTPKRRLDESEITEVKEDSSSTTYSSFRKSKYSAAWSAGDFSMINAIFPNRKRRELKNKFKREERRNGALVEKALRETKTFDFSNFKNMEEDDNVADSQRVSGETKTVTKPSKKRKKKKTEDPEDSYVAPRSRKADNNNQEDDNDDEPIEIVEDALPSSTDTELTSAIIPENEQTKKDALESLQNPFASTKVLFAKAEERKSSGEEDEFDMESIL
ncbi:putative transcription factor TFIIIB component B''-like isoform X2, partial [Apostichopus japonicus]